MTERGRILYVQDIILGSSLAQDLAGGGTTAYLADATDFDEDGGQVLFRDEATGTEVTGTYTAVNDDLETITLSAAVGAFVTGSSVEVYPRKTTRYAHIVIDGADNTLSDPTFARVPHSLFDRIPSGSRDAGGEEWVQLEHDGHEWYIMDLFAQKPQISAADVTVIGTKPLSDGTPPTLSPAPTLRGGIGQLFIEWDAQPNNDPITYEVHISLTNGFTANATSYHGETSGTLYAIRTLPDGTALDYNVTYYVRIIAKDVDGAAAQSTQASGSPTQATSPDIAVNAVTADKILAGSIDAERLAGILVLGSAIIAGAQSGQRVELDANGARLISSAGDTLIDLPTDPSKNPYFQAVVQALGLDVLGDATFRGALNKLAPAAKLYVGNTVPDPTTAPVLTVTWDTVDVGSGPYRSGLSWHSGSSRFWTTNNELNGNIFSFSSAGVIDVVVAANSGAGGDRTPYGAARVGSDLWVLTYGVTSGWRYQKRNATTGAMVAEYTIASPPPNPGILSYDGTYLCLPWWDSGTDAWKIDRYIIDSPPVYDNTKTFGTTPGGTGGTCLPKSVAFYNSRWWFSADGSRSGIRDKVWCYLDSTGARSTGDDFPLPVYSYGITHDGTQFWSMRRGENKVTKHSNWTTGTTETYYARYSWYNNSSTKESAVSTYSSISGSLIRRAKVALTTPSLPSGVDRVKVWLYYGTGYTTLSNYERQTTASTVTTTLSDFITTNSDTPLSATTFVAGTAAEILSEAGSAKLRGDGLIQLGSFGSPPGGTRVVSEVFYRSDTKHAMFRGEGDASDHVLMTDYLFARNGKLWGPYNALNISGTQSTAQVMILGATDSTFSIGTMAMPYSGRVLGLVVRGSVDLTGSQACRLRLFKNGTDTSESVLLDSTNVRNIYATNFTTTFAAGDLIDARWTSASLPAGYDVCVFILLAFDTQTP